MDETRYTVQELFSIMARDYDDSEVFFTHAISIGNPSTGRSGFYKVINHNQNISIHNALWYIQQLGFELKAINTKTGQEYPLERERNLVIRQKKLS